MDQPTLHTVKRTFFFNFFPTKADEEAYAAQAICQPPRSLMEIRDLYPPPMLNPQDPWQIRKTLTQLEINNRKLIVSFHDTFEYIIRYWALSIAKQIVNSKHKVTVILWDLTDGHKPKKYEGLNVYFQRTQFDDYILSCPNLMLDRNLRVNDYIGLYWNPRDSNFHIKVFYKTI